jgi:predicted Rossmann fold nucleotide-binding protein DprA/Smf involved in DNA uptake
MKKLQDLLKSISKSLVALSKQVDKISKQADKLQPAKSSKKKAPAKKVNISSSKKAVGEKHMTVIDSVFEVIKRSRKGATIVNLKEKTGFDSRQLSNALYKLSKRGMIESKTRGVYMKK